MGVLVGFKVGVCVIVGLDVPVAERVGIGVFVAPAVFVAGRLGVRVIVGWFTVGEPGDAKVFCCAGCVNASRVRATLVATVLLPGVGPAPAGRLQVARSRMSNPEIARRERIGFICSNTPSIA
jgi:hypothetical protein